MKGNSQSKRKAPIWISLDLPGICDICGQARSTQRHATCSRIRKQRMAAKRSGVAS